MAFTTNCRLIGTGTALTSFSLALTGWTVIGSGTTAPKAGDMVVLITTSQVASNTFSQTAGTSWSIFSTDNNGGTNPMTTAIATRQWDGTETAPTFAWGSSSRGCWGAWAFTPSTGNTAVVDVWATTKIDSTAATTHTPNSATTANTVLSIILAGFVAAATGTTGITATPPTSWVGGGIASLGGTVGATFSVAAGPLYRLSTTGTVSPGAVTNNVSDQATVYHVLVQEVASVAAAIPDVVMAAN